MCCTVAAVGGQGYACAAYEEDLALFVLERLSPTALAAISAAITQALPSLTPSNSTVLRQHILGGQGKVLTACHCQLHAVIGTADKTGLHMQPVDSQPIQICHSGIQ